MNSQSSDYISHYIFSAMAIAMVILTNITCYSHAVLTKSKQMYFDRLSNASFARRKSYYDKERISESFHFHER